MYCQDYLKNLKFGYKMYLDLEKLLKEKNISLEKVEIIFNNNYNLIYENRII
jgi:hypothetical protein